MIPDHRIVTRHKPAAATLPFGLDTDVPIDPDPLEPHPEHPTPIELVVRLTQSERVTRVKRLTEMAWNRYDQALDSLKPRFVKGKWTPDKTVVATCSLVSGGNDSYTVAHLFRSVSTHQVHANTGTGIEATREFVRATAAEWNVPLLEVHPKRGQGYFDLVRGAVMARNKKTGELVQAWSGGFPSSAAHAIMYTRIKERGLERVPHLLGISGSRTERVVYIAGRRRSESKRRSTVPHFEEKNTVLWNSPLAVWHKADLRAYRMWQHKLYSDWLLSNPPSAQQWVPWPGRIVPVPSNPVAQVLGMSGECGCLANATHNERDQWFAAYPDEPFILAIQAMEVELESRTDIPEHRKKWGWGSDPVAQEAEAIYMAEQRRKGKAVDPIDFSSTALCGPNCGPDPISDGMDPLFDLEDVA